VVGGGEGGKEGKGRGGAAAAGVIRPEGGQWHVRAAREGRGALRLGRGQGGAWTAVMRLDGVDR
jgi:hypothetical protein